MKAKDTLKTLRELLAICLIGTVLGILIGAIDALFGRVLLFIGDFRSAHVWALVPFLALAGAVIVFAYEKFGKGTSSGMSLIFAAGHGENKDIPLRLVPFVMVSTWLTHLFGGSAGREGVAVQIGGAIFFRVGKMLPVRNAGHILLVAGMAAGFAGLFQTPLAAVCFACEVLVSGVFELKALLPAVLASFAASSTSGLLGLEKFSVHVSFGTGLSLPVFGKLIALGIIFGLTGCLFASLLKWAKRLFANKLPQPIFRIAAAGIFLSAALLLLQAGRYSGLGTNLISASFNGGRIYCWDWAVKIILTVITLAAGFQGGEVTPLFSVGASLGAVLGGLMGLPAELTAALGYAAVFGSASNTFLAPVFIGAEVFGFENLPLFFIVCAVSKFCNMNRSIYGAQKLSA